MDEPDKLGRYVLLEERGRGGLGRVFAAHDPQLARQVAVKVLHPSGPDDEAAKARLLREARATAKVNHPNVVGVFDSGQDAGVVYIAMELVEGVALSTWLKLQERDWRSIRDVFCQAARGLAAAHGSGLVHRDFKPANAIVGTDGRVRVVDFGLAVAVGARVSSRDPAAPQADPAAVRVTQTGSMVGTPAYLSPEQLDPNGAEVGPAADQFSLCVALYEALYRESPFATGDLDKRRREILGGPPTPPRTASVPGWVGTVLRRGLHPDPHERYGSMLDLVADLQRDRRRRRWVIAVAAALVVIGAGEVWIGRTLASPELSEEQRSRVDALRDEARAAAAGASYVYPPPDDPDGPTAYTKLLELEALGPSAQPIGGELRREFADALIRLGDDVAAREGGQLFASDFYAQALLFDADDPKARERASLTAPQLADLAERAAVGEFNEAERSVASVLAVVAEPDAARRKQGLKRLYSGPRPPSPLQTARLERMLSEPERELVATALGHPRVPKPNLPETGSKPPQVDAPADLGGGVGPPAAVAPAGDRASAKRLVAQARAALRSGKWPEAERLLHQALERSPGAAPALAGLAELAFERGRYPKAIKYASRAVKSSPRNASYRLLLGDAYQNVFEYGKAREQYRQAARLGSASAKKRLDALAARTNSP